MKTYSENVFTIVFLFFLLRYMLLVMNMGGKPLLIGETQSRIQVWLQAVTDLDRRANKEAQTFFETRVPRSSSGLRHIPNRTVNFTVSVSRGG